MSVERIDPYGVLAKMCVDHAELPEFPADGRGGWNASLVAKATGIPVEHVHELSETEARARWKAAHAVRWTEAWAVQVQMDMSRRERRTA